MTEPVSELVAVPDVEKAIRSYLNTELTARGMVDRVATEVPDPRPDRLVVVGLTGGGTRNLIQRNPTLLVQCWAPDKGTAFGLAQMAHALIWAAPGRNINGVWVYRAEDGSGPINFPDPATRNPRYQFAVALTVRVDVLSV